MLFRAFIVFWFLAWVISGAIYARYQTQAKVDMVFGSAIGFLLAFATVLMAQYILYGGA